VGVKIKMKNKKGEAIGGIILFAVMVIVAASFLPAIFSSQAQMTNPYTVSNETYSTAAAGSSVYITGQDLIGTPSEIWNATGAQLPCINNFTFSEVVRTDTGVKGIQMTSVASKKTADCNSVNISYQYGGEGYVDDSGGRGIANLIGLFAAIALLGGAIFYWVKSGGFDFLGK
jgi:hypothetical protein